MCSEVCRWNVCLEYSDRSMYVRDRVEASVKKFVWVRRLRIRPVVFQAKTQQDTIQLRKEVSMGETTGRRRRPHPKIQCLHQMIQDIDRVRILQYCHRQFYCRNVCIECSDAVTLRAVSRRLTASLCCSCSMSRNISPPASMSIARPINVLHICAAWRKYRPNVRKNGENKQ